MSVSNTLLNKTENMFIEQALKESINRIIDGNGAEAMLCVAQALSLIHGKDGVVGNKAELLQILPGQLKGQIDTHYGMQKINKRIPPSMLFEIFRVSSSSDCLGVLKSNDGEIALNTMSLSALGGDSARVKEAFGFLNKNAQEIFTPGFRAWVELID